MSTRAKGSVRMGPISLFSLIILLSLAVLAVLAVSTAQANYASAEKQARFTTDTYANEAAGQEILAQVDAELAKLREQGVSKDQALESLRDALPNGVWIEDDTVRAELYQESGRMLFISLEINSDLEYEVTQWQAKTRWADGGASETLWSGE